MRTLRLTALLFLLIALPASASVRVNEIAWMGTETSANDEWIELYYPLDTSGAGSVSLEGWHLSGKDGSPNIALKESITAGGYYLIERTSDATLPTIDADLVASFGKGLSNSGERLVLSDASGTPIDMVTGGKDWSKVGGSNISKETAQRTQNKWITAPGTPRMQNAAPLPRVVKMEAVAEKKTLVASVPKTALLAGAQAADLKAKTQPPSLSPEAHIATSAVAANVLWEKQDSGVNGTMLLWVSLAIMLFIVATIIIMRAEVAQPSDADQYAIIEDIIEGDEEDAKIYLDKKIWDE